MFMASSIPGEVECHPKSDNRPCDALHTTYNGSCPTDLDFRKSQFLAAPRHVFLGRILEVDGLKIERRTAYGTLACVRPTDVKRLSTMCRFEPRGRYQLRIRAAINVGDPSFARAALRPSGGTS